MHEIKIFKLGRSRAGAPDVKLMKPMAERGISQCFKKGASGFLCYGNDVMLLAFLNVRSTFTSTQDFLQSNGPPIEVTIGWTFEHQEPLKRKLGELSLLINRPLESYVCVVLSKCGGHYQILRSTSKVLLRTKLLAPREKSCNLVQKNVAQKYFVF